MPPVSPRPPLPASTRASARVLLGGFLALVLGVGCGDLEPAALVSVEEESPVPTLHLRGGLPSVPGLMDRWGRDLPLGDLHQQWTDSWRLPEEEGDRVRSEAIHALVLLLEPRLPAPELEGELQRLRKALDDVAVALEGRDLEALDGPVADAARSGARALEFWERGDGPEALRWALVSSDHLRRATPEVVTRTLILDVEARLAERRNDGADPYSEETRARAARLLLGAQEALRTGDAPRALRRAWYAVGLLEARADPAWPGGTDEPQTDGP